MSEATTAIVTGAASGIGFATARRLARAGYRLATVDVDGAGLRRVADAIAEAGGEAITYPLDVRDPAGFAAVADDLEARHGVPGLLVNVAGVGVALPLHETTPADWERVLGVNLTAVFHTCHVLVPRMLRAGAGVIINVASVAGVVGLRNRAAYCASKAGVLGLTRSLAADYAHLGIRANAICPGTVATEWIDKIVAGAPNPDAAREEMASRQLDGQMGTAEEVADGIAFLAGARFCNGSALIMDGGGTAV